VADLSCPLLGQAASFDVVASYLVLNDVPDYRGFARTIGIVLRPGGRAVLALNNHHYTFLSRHVTDYFDSGHVSPYRAEAFRLVRLGQVFTFGTELRRCGRLAGLPTG